MSVITNTAERTKALNKLADGIRADLAVWRETNQAIGDKLLLAVTYYPANMSDQFYAWAMNVTGWSKPNVKNVMDSAAILGKLNKSQREKVGKWSTASIVSLAPAAGDKGKLRDVVSAIRGTRPDPKTVREIRDSVLDRKSNPRVSKTDADRTRDLAESIRELVERNAAPGSADQAERVRLMVVGAQLALDKGRLTAAAIQYVGKNPVPTTEPEETTK